VTDKEILEAIGSAEEKAKTELENAKLGAQELISSAKKRAKEIEDKARLDAIEKGKKDLEAVDIEVNSIVMESVNGSKKKSEELKASLGKNLPKAAEALSREALEKWPF